MIDPPALRKTVAWASLALTGLLLAASAARIVKNHQTPGPFDPSKPGFVDFHNGIYFPSKAFIERVSPYSQYYAANYPTPRSTPFFSPLAFALHAPWALLPLAVAEILYFAWMVIVIGAIAALVTRWLGQLEGEFGCGDEGGRQGFRWDRFGCIALAVVFSRGGHQTIYTGYFTFEMILATLVAVHYGKSRPGLSALALVIVSFKPNYVLPIGILMLARGNYKAVIAGGLLSTGLAAASFAWIMPDGGPAELIEQISTTQEIHHADAMERPVDNWVRVDAAAVLAKWCRSDFSDIQYLGMMLVLIIPVAVLLHLYHRRYPDDPGSAVMLTGGLVLLTSIVTIYHHVYDTLLVVGVAAAMAWNLNISPFHPRAMAKSDAGTDSSAWSRWGAYALALGLYAPGLNYLSSQSLIQKLQIEGVFFQWVTSFNAIMLFAVWIVFVLWLSSALWPKNRA